MHWRYFSFFSLNFLHSRFTQEIGEKLCNVSIGESSPDQVTHSQSGSSVKTTIVKTARSGNCYMLGYVEPRKKLRGNRVTKKIRQRGWMRIRWKKHSINIWINAVYAQFALTVHNLFFYSQHKNHERYLNFDVFGEHDTILTSGWDRSTYKYINIYWTEVCKEPENLNWCTHSHAFQHKMTQLIWNVWTCRD